MEMIKHKSKITLENKVISDLNKQYLLRFRKSLIARKRKESTIYNYAKDIEQFMQYIQKDMNEICEEDIDRYLKDFKKNGNQYKRIVRRFRVISSFFSFLLDRKYIEEDVTLDINIKEYE